LLVGAGFDAEKRSRLAAARPGFDAHNVLTFSVNLAYRSYPYDKSIPDQNTAALNLIMGSPTGCGIFRRRGCRPGEQHSVDGGSTVRFVVQGRPMAAGAEDESQILTGDVELFFCA